jgi:TetR/AcrR family transcriptional regulator
MTSGQTTARTAIRAGQKPAVRAGERQRARQDKIVAIAMEHFARHGYEGARVEAIAAAAGVAKGEIFGYFVC